MGHAVMGALAGVVRILLLVNFAYRTGKQDKQVCKQKTGRSTY